MKVFISWSGETSKNIAEIFRQWLPSVIQVVKPYYSPDDIAKGARWSSEIANELDESKMGIICLTKDNLSSPWVMFEAGALSKNIDNSKVCPILFGIDPSDIQGPLVQFQAAKFDKDEVKKVVRMMNSELGDNGLNTEVFENVFEMWWPKLQTKIEAEMNKPKKSNGKELRSERDLLEEILSLSRNMNLSRQRGFEPIDSIHPGAIEELVISYSGIVNSLFSDDKTHELNNLARMYKPLDYIVKQSVTGSVINSTRRTLEETYSRLQEYHPRFKGGVKRRVSVAHERAVVDNGQDLS